MGIKSMKGVGEIYSETKQVVSVGLTPTAIEGLNVLAKEMGISRSELIEQIGRGLLKIVKAQGECANECECLASKKRTPSTSNHDHSIHRRL